MNNDLLNDDLLKQSLSTAKTIAMIGISSVKKEKTLHVVRRPSIIVMSYMQEFGYKVIPVNPFSAGKIVNGEKIIENLENINQTIDIINVFRPSEETPKIAKLAVKLEAKMLWLQFGIHNKQAQDITNAANITYIANKCIKQEYQRLFMKMSPVFPVLKSH